jgi:hypothetical protein
VEAYCWRDALAFLHYGHWTMLSAETDEGVQWRGEHNALTGRREKAAFVSQLATLGYSPHEFRVTVRLVPSGALDGKRQRYTVLVAQLRNGVPYRGKRYVGGQGADWVDAFSNSAAAAFPHGEKRGAPEPPAP